MRACHCDLLIVMGGSNCAATGVVSTSGVTIISGTTVSAVMGTSTMTTCNVMATTRKKPVVVIASGQANPSLGGQSGGRGLFRAIRSNRRGSSHHSALYRSHHDATHWRDCDQTGKLTGRLEKLPGLLRPTEIGCERKKRLEHVKLHEGADTLCLERTAFGVLCLLSIPVLVELVANSNIFQLKSKLLRVNSLYGPVKMSRERDLRGPASVTERFKLLEALRAA